MSAICGLQRYGGAPVDPREIEAMLDALDHWHADARGAWTRGGAGLGHLLLRTSLHDDGSQPLHDAASGCTITGDVRLDNRDSLRARLDVRDAPDTALVLRAYLQWGEACAAHLTGDFAFAIHDERQRRIFAARDMFGVRPFYYTRTHEAFAFATQIRALLALPFVDRALNEIWIADYLHRVAIDRTETFYAAVKRLEPGHAIIAGTEGARIFQYRALDPHREDALPSDDDYVDAFREKLVRAVRRRIDGVARPGAELSGGLDSSAICAIAQQIARDDGSSLRTFAQVQPGSGDVSTLPKDGRGSIDRVRAHAGISGTTFLDGDAGILAALERATAVLDEPPRNMVSFYNDDLYDAAAASGVNVLLSGFGGNQGVSAVAFDRRRELLYSGHWIELGREAAARKHKRHPLLAVLGLLWHEIDWHAVDARLGRSRFWKRQPERLAHDALARRVGMRRRGLRYLREDQARGTLREQAIKQLNLPIIAHRLEYAHHMVCSRRIEYRYPLFDEELIACYLAAPSRLKFHRGVGRRLFRLSLAGLVPDDVRWDDGPRASANPGSVRRRRRDREALLARVAGIPPSSPLFEYVDPRKLANASRQAGTPGYERYTEILMALVLEQKLRELRP